MSLPTPDSHSPTHLLLRHLGMVTPLTGDVVECGVYRGGTTIRLASVLAGELRRSSKKLYACDTFSGVHPILNFGGASSSHLDCRPVDLVLKLREDGLLDVVEFVFGYVDVTMPRLFDKSSFSFAWVDVDTANGTMFCLDFLSDRMVPGGIVGVHDYKAPWSRETVDAAVDNTIAADGRYVRIEEAENSVFFERKR